LVYFSYLPTCSGGSGLVIKLFYSNHAQGGQGSKLPIINLVCYQLKLTLLNYILSAIKLHLKISKVVVIMDFLTSTE